MSHLIYCAHGTFFENSLLWASGFIFDYCDFFVFAPDLLHHTYSLRGAVHVGSHHELSGLM